MSMTKKHRPKRIRGERKSVIIRLDPDFADQLQKLAGEAGLSRNQLIMHALRRYVGDDPAWDITEEMIADAYRDRQYEAIRREEAEREAVKSPVVKGGRK